MVTNHKVSGKAMTVPAGLGFGLAAAIALTLTSAAIIANLILAEKMGESAIGYCAMAVLLMSSAASAWISAALIKRRWMIMCLGAGGLYYLVLLAMTALFFGGQYQGMGVTALVTLAGSGAVGLLGLRGESGRVKRHKKYRPR